MVASVAMDRKNFNLGLYATQCSCFVCVYVNLAEPAKVTDNDKNAVETPTSAAQNMGDTSEDLVFSPDLEDHSEATCPTTGLQSILENYGLDRYALFANLLASGSVLPCEGFNFRLYTCFTEIAS